MACAGPGDLRAPAPALVLAAAAAAVVATVASQATVWWPEAPQTCACPPGRERRLRGMGMAPSGCTELWALISLIGLPIAFKR